MEQYYLPNKLNLEILTPDGFKKFEGIRKTSKKVFKFYHEKGNIEVSYDHKFIVNGKSIKVIDLKIGDFLEYKNSKVKINKIENIGIIDVYDPVNVGTKYHYLGNYITHHNCKFLGSTNTVINPEVLRTLMNMDKDPKFLDLKDRLRVWEKPVDGARYVLGVDPAKGTGEHFSTIQILRINSTMPIDMTQVACFEDNLTDVYEFSQIIHRLSIYYNNGYILCENNGEGSAVISQIWWNWENESLVNSGAKTASLGIRSNKNTKPKAVLLMKKLIEDGSVEIFDRETIEQLGSYIEEENKFFGKDKDDDLVDALFWACYLFEMNILENEWQFKDGKAQDEDDAWGILSDIEDDIDDWSWLTNSSVFDN